MESKGKEQRDKILAVLEKNPGLHFRAIQRETLLAVGQLEYHLYQLEKSGIVSSKKDGRFKRFFLSDSSSFMERSISYHMRNKVSRGIIFRLLREGSDNDDILRKKIKINIEEFEVSINSLKNDGIIIIDGHQISLYNPKLIKRSIKGVKTSFMQELAEGFIDLLDSD
ncbi:MAG: winged helix-turn-helix transcriptional regulator [Thermoplasmataceae archaeon]